MALAPLLALSACTLGPDYQPPTPAVLQVEGRYTQQATSEAADGERADLAQWWTELGDALLGQLVLEATAGNLDLAQAAARYAQARETLRQARADQGPTLAPNGSVGRSFNEPGPDGNSFSQSLEASWSADLFGGLRRNREASQAALEAAGFSLANVRTLVAADVATSYIDLRRAQQRLAIARETLAVQDDNAAIAGFRGQAGLVSGLDVEQARAQRAATAATLPTLRANELSARYRLAVLTGEAPGQLDARLAEVAEIPDGSALLALGIPADTLRQRPDVRSAERQLAAATARIGVAEAQLKPALTLSGSLGSAATSFGGLGKVITGTLFVAVSQVIYDGGRRRAVVRQREAEATEALALYRQRVLEALEDVENAQLDRRTVAERLVALGEQVEASARAAELARSSYRSGLTDFSTLLDAERTLLSARDGLASARGDQARALVQLCLALGGGWQPTAPGPAP